MQIFIQCLHRVCSASFCAPSRFALAFKWALGERIRAFHTDRRRTSGSRILAIQAWNLPFVSDSPLNLLIFLYYYYLIYFADGLSVAFSFSLSSFAVNLLLPFVLLLSLRPPAWPCCFVSMLFSLTVIMARLLCILREKRVCLPSANPQPLHNYGWPWQCTGWLTPASRWCECWQARPGLKAPSSLSILSRKWYGQSHLPVWPILFIMPSVAR